MLQDAEELRRENRGPMSTMTHTELRSGDQMVHFDGEVIGRASSKFGYRGEHKPRWTEITIYRTNEGKYVVNKVGKSRVVHITMKCRVLKYNEDPLELVSVPDQAYVLCEKCWVPGAAALPEGYLENDHGTASVADRPEGAIAACYKREPNGLFSLSWLAEEALLDAREQDPDLRAAFDNFNIGSLGRGTR